MDEKDARTRHLIFFTSVIASKNAMLVQYTAKSVGADSYMIETDCP